MKLLKTIITRYKLFDINSLSFKISSLLAVLMYLPMVITIGLQRPNISDVMPTFKPIAAEAGRLGSLVVPVKVGLFIKEFPTFDIIKNNFLVDSVIWFEFNADEIMLQTIEKFTIDNGKIYSRSAPDIKIKGKQIFARYSVLFELNTKLTFHKFPFEDHRLPIIISNDFVTPGEMIYVVNASSFQTTPNLAPPGWNIQDLHVDTGYTSLQLDKEDASKKAEIPKACFIINFEKASSRKALIIFIPLFAAAFLSLLSFIMNIGNVVGRFSLVISAITSLLSYRFVIEQMMPQVGYFTTTDIIYLFLLLFTFLIFVAQLLLTRQYLVKSDAAKEAPPADQKSSDTSDTKIGLEKFNTLLFILMSLLLVITTTYIILK